MELMRSPGMTSLPESNLAPPPLCIQKLVGAMIGVRKCLIMINENTFYAVLDPFTCACAVRETDRRTHESLSLFSFLFYMTISTLLYRRHHTPQKTR